MTRNALGFIAIVVTMIVTMIVSATIASFGAFLIIIHAMTNDWNGGVAYLLALGWIISIISIGGWIVNYIETRNQS